MRPTRPIDSPVQARAPLGRRAFSFTLCLLAGWSLALGCGDSAAAARTERLGLLEKESAARTARSESFGQETPFLAGIRAILQQVGPRTYIPTEDGVLHVLQLRSFHQWNSTEAGRSVPRANDYERSWHPVHEIVARAEALRAEGVDYLHVLVPNRLEIYPELIFPQLAGAADFPGMNPGTIRFQEELAKRGVEVVSLLDLLADNRFDAEGKRWLFRRAHPIWTPRAILLAATRIAAAVEAFPWFERGTAQEGLDYRVGTTPIRPVDALPEEIASLPGFEEPEVMPCEAVVTSELLPAHVPDRESPIVLIGDQALTIFDQVGCDLASQLYRRLGLRLDVVSAVVAGRDESWSTFERRPDAYSGKRLVIEINSAGFRLPPSEHAALPGQ